MSMNKENGNAYLNGCTDNAIKRGYEIYDKWVVQKHGSREIVASARGAVTLFKKRKNMAAFINALAHVFALDTRIKEKYNNLLNYVNYLAEKLDTSISHQDHIAEEANKMIAHQDYLAENMNKMIAHQNHIVEESNKIIPLHFLF